MRFTLRPQAMDVMLRMIPSITFIMTCGRVVCGILIAVPELCLIWLSRVG